MVRIPGYHFYPLHPHTLLLLLPPTSTPRLLPLPTCATLPRDVALEGGEEGEEEEDPEGLPSGVGRHHPSLDRRGHVVPHLQARGYFKVAGLSTCRSTGEPPLT